MLQRLLGCVNVMGTGSTAAAHNWMGQGVRASCGATPQKPGQSQSAVQGMVRSSCRGSTAMLGTLSRDLLVARQWRKDIYLHSLECCARQGFIPYLKNFDGHSPLLHRTARPEK